MKDAVSELNRQFGIPGVAHVEEGNGGLPKVRVTSPGGAAWAGEIYLHGAHVTSWKPAAGEEVFFVSSQSRWKEGIAIRGGVPICFPWFGAKADDPKAPAHGFVRTKAWQLESIARDHDAVVVSMSTESDEDTRPWWTADFRLVYRATFASELTLELEVTNTGANPLRFEEALHAYHRVGSVEMARVRGLNGVRYLDKTESYREKTQQGEIAIVSETDRVYLNTVAAIELHDPSRQRATGITKENSRTTVVWNPWTEKAHSLPDFADDEWRQMICIETSNVSDYSVSLEPGQRHSMKAAVSVANS